ncbi:hypothetical protein BMETH_3293_0 [methanotrophic bacterial endosymbiont of Bathymodiolus sp.]|nr:hypothetical protein BMETH_3293_0 [methanotrophic bacterial endosymbiont of Bathymodiolus sp.]
MKWQQRRTPCRCNRLKFIRKSKRDNLFNKLNRISLGHNACH